MSEFAVNVLLGAENGVTNEATREFDSWEALIDGLRELESVKWSAITIIHIEDLPVLMEGAVRR